MKNILVQPLKIAGRHKRRGAVGKKPGAAKVKLPASLKRGNRVVSDIVWDYPISTTLACPGLVIRDGPDKSLIVTLEGDASGNHVICPLVEGLPEQYEALTVCWSALLRAAGRSADPLPPLNFRYSYYPAAGRSADPPPEPPLPPLNFRYSGLV